MTHVFYANILFASPLRFPHVSVFPATSGGARVAGHDIATEIDLVHLNTGLCPQFNILWDTLTVRGVGLLRWNDCGYLALWPGFGALALLRALEGYSTQAREEACQASARGVRLVSVQEAKVEAAQRWHAAPPLRCN